MPRRRWTDPTSLGPDRWRRRAGSARHVESLTRPWAWGRSGVIGCRRKEVTPLRPPPLPLPSWWPVGSRARVSSLVRCRLLWVVGATGHQHPSPTQPRVLRRLPQRPSVARRVAGARDRRALCSNRARAASQSLCCANRRAVLTRAASNSSGVSPPASRTAISRSSAERYSVKWPRSGSV